MLTWSDVIGSEKEQDYFKSTLATVRAEREAGKVIYPPATDVFNAFKLTELDQVKVVILGQDPYHGPNQAHGLCFSVLPGVRTPPSLVNIYKEMQRDLPGFVTPNHGFLESWAKQGVLLLNTVLTVENKYANSHASWGWQAFTTEVIRATAKLPQPIVYILWGGQARAACAEMPLFESGENKATLWSNHPSPLSASRPPVPFFGSRPFSTTNMILKTYGSAPIDWELE